MDEPASPSARLRDAFEYFPWPRSGGISFGAPSLPGWTSPGAPSIHGFLVRPGFVTYACRVPAGTTRDLFLAMTSLMPGSLPTEVDERGVLLMHCLDTDQPLADQMADTEARLLRALEQRAANA